MRYYVANFFCFKIFGFIFLILNMYSITYERFKFFFIQTTFNTNLNTILMKLTWERNKILSRILILREKISSINDYTIGIAIR